MSMNPTNNIHIVRSLFETGIPDEGTYGYMGATTRDIENLISHGCMIVEPDKGRNEFNSIYLLSTEQRNDYGVEALNSAKNHARRSERYLHIKRRLAFTPELPEFVENLADNWHPDWKTLEDIRCRSLSQDTEDIVTFFKQADQYGISVKQFGTIIAQECKPERLGVVIGLSDGIKDITSQRNHPESYSTFIDRPGGIPLQYVTGIEPIGQHDYDLIGELFGNG